MQKSNLKVLAADGDGEERAPERARLAEAIERHAELTRRLAAIDTAQSTAWTAYKAATAAVAAATAAIEKAKVEAGQHLTAIALGESVAAPKSVQQSRVEAQAAQDQLDAAQSARAALAEQRRETADLLATAKLSRDDAARKVVETDPATLALVATFKNKLRDLTDMRRALEFIEAKLPPDLRGWRSAEPWPELAGDAPWREALAALLQDADAPLPVS